MGCGSILFVRGAVSDVAVQDNECRTILSLHKHAERSLNAIDIICIPT